MGRRDALQHAFLPGNLERLPNHQMLAQIEAGRDIAHHIARAQTERQPNASAPPPRMKLVTMRTILVSICNCPTAIMATTNMMRPETSLPNAGAKSIPELRAASSTVLAANCAMEVPPPAAAAPR